MTPVALLAVLLATSLSTAAAPADSSGACAGPERFSAAEHDRLLRFAAHVRITLQAQDAPVALLARSGLDLTRFDHRYSHAGVALRDHPLLPWAVRQLYVACDEAAPRLFDQGLTGFVLGGGDADRGHLVLWLVPPEAARALARVADDQAQALSLLDRRYSANAHAFGLRYQNCNQWLAELLGLAWSDAAAGVAAGPTVADRRSAAQSWLRANGYAGSPMAVGFAPWMALVALLPWLHNDDHPEADLSAGVYRVSMPASIETWLRQRWPQTQRIEFCRDRQRSVRRLGWQPLDEHCTPGPGDEVQALD